MEIFLNEQSLHSQFPDIQRVTDAVVMVNQVLLRLADSNLEKRVLFTPQMYGMPTVRDYVFSSCLERIQQKDVRILFKRLIRERLGAASWRDEAHQENCDYYWEQENVRDTSVAELAERLFQGLNGFLLNFIPSRFPSGVSIEVTKNSSQVAGLDSVSSISDLERVCPSLQIPNYDPNCNRTPRDEETVLCDRARFVKTKLKNQGRAIYLEQRTGFYFCVDNLHEFGAHLEVFSALGTHLGEANLEGIIDFSKEGSNKDLVL